MVLPFLAGAAAGVVVALLTAPQSGRDTRKKLKVLAGRAKRVPPALQAAYKRASEAGKETFTRTLHEPAFPAPSKIQSRQH
jgi:gas vesicle protein